MPDLFNIPPTYIKISFIFSEHKLLSVYTVLQLQGAERFFAISSDKHIWKKCDLAHI